LLNDTVETAASGRSDHHINAGDGGYILHNAGAFIWTGAVPDCHVG
jgi:hypothetical protein